MNSCPYRGVSYQRSEFNLKGQSKLRPGVALKPGAVR